MESQEVIEMEPLIQGKQEPTPEALKAEVEADLLRCAHGCQIGGLTQLLKKNTELDLTKIRDPDDGYTALHYISFANSEDFDKKDGRRVRCAKKLLKYRKGIFKNDLLNVVKDNLGNTPLHLACVYKRYELVNLFVEKQNGAESLVKRNEKDKRTAVELISASQIPFAVECLENMLNLERECKRLNTENQMAYFKPAFIVSLEACSLNMIKFWIEKEKVDITGIDILHVVAAADDSKINAECIKYLLDPTRDICKDLQIGQGDIGTTALQLAAEMSHKYVVAAILEKRSYRPDDERRKQFLKKNLLHVDDYNRNVLHYIVKGHLNPTSVEILALINFRTKYWLPGKTLEKRKFYFQQDKDGNTAFNLSCACKAINLVTEFYKVPFRNLEPSPFLSKQFLSLVYGNCPTSLIPFLDTSVLDINSSSVTLDFKYIVGYDDDQEEDVRTEDTKCLFQILNSDLPDRDKLLNHPVMKLYLDTRWKSAWPLVWMWTIFHLIFIVMYSIVMINLKTPEATESNDNVTINEMNIDSLKNSTSESEHITDRSIPEGEGMKWSVWLLSAVFIATAFMGVVVLSKEILQVTSNGLCCHFNSPANRGQLMFLIAFFASMSLYCLLTFTDVTGDSDIAKAFYILFAVLGIVLGWTMLLRDIGKLPQFERFAEIFAKVCKSSFILSLFYLPCIIGSAIAFRLLFPNNESLQLPSGFIKIFAMMAGDLGYDDLFHDDENQVQLKIIALPFFLVFVFLVPIVLFNLLVALAVTDMDELQRSAERVRIVGQVQFIYYVEKVILRLCKWLPSSTINKFLGLRCNNASRIELVHTVDISAYPITLQNELVELYKRTQANKKAMEVQDQKLTLDQSTQTDNKQDIEEPKPSTSKRHSALSTQSRKI